METTIQIFTSDIFGEVRTCQVNNQIMFVGKDVAQALGYCNTRDALNKHVDAEDKGVAKCDTLGGGQNLVFINESGLYSLILSPKLPQAKAFKRWVTSEVLPSIRRTGRYELPQQIPALAMLNADAEDTLDVHGKKRGLNLISYIAGDFASGKGDIDPLIRDINKRPIKDCALTADILCDEGAQ